MLWPSVVDADWRLLLVKERELVGHYCTVHDVYQIGKVAILPLNKKSLPTDFELDVSCQQFYTYLFSNAAQVNRLS